jgi:hypothetical protein
MEVSGQSNVAAALPPAKTGSSVRTIEHSVGLRAALDAMKKRTNGTPVVRLTARCYTDWAISVFAVSLNFLHWMKL